ncbi:alpha/beta hydrolase [Rhodoblastus sp.]|uniref:alpha/beta hydrolase n=1 Tax=Rhodoblastus sp. TaxID=1962975 RepID=UPI003F970B66
MTEFVEGPALAALSCGKPAYLVVLIPGGDVDAQAMLDLALGWAPAMPKADFVTLQARETEASWEGLDLFLDEMLARRRLPDSHLALVGFSDGATLALRVGLGRRSAIAALVAFSATAYDAEFETHAQPPLLLVHGEADRISPYQSMLAFKAALKEKGAPVWSFKRPGLGHAIDDDGVAAAGDFLARHVVHPAPAQHDHAHS